MDNLFEQMANISKAGAYDILVEQVGELKKENAKLREVLAIAMKSLATYGQHPLIEHSANEALKVTKFS